MKHLLIVIDMQNDFIDGSLGTSYAPSILPFVKQEICSSEYDGVVATMDTHQSDYLDTFEGKHLPVEHCIQGTQGWKIHSDILDALNARQATIFQKDHFASLDLIDYVANNDVQKVTMLGICTDICVVSNALLLKAHFPNLPIIVKADGCSATSKQAQQSSIEILKNCQIEVI